MNLFFDQAGNLNVISYAGNGTVYAFDPKSPTTNHPVESPARGARPGLTAVLPVDYWRNENDFLEAVSAKKPFNSSRLTAPRFFLRATTS